VKNILKTPILAEIAILFISLRGRIIRDKKPIPSVIIEIEAGPTR